MYLGAVPVAFYRPMVSLAMISVVALMWLLPPKAEASTEGDSSQLCGGLKLRRPNPRLRSKTRLRRRIKGRLTVAMELSGCGTALVTPFRDGGGLDEPALHRLVNWQIDSGVDFLVPCGTTGEASTMTEAEVVRVVETVAGTAAGRVPVFAGCTLNATREAVARARKLAKVSNLTGLLTASPFYNRPGQEGQYQHFRAIAEAVEMPVLLYNIPSRTGANLEPATVLRLAEIRNIVGIKESSGNLVQITELMTQAPRSFKVFSGDDGLALPTLALGAAGLISVASNAIPTQMARMVRAALSGDWPAARNINRQFYRLIQAHFWEPSPGPVKAVLALLGRGEDHLRMPMLRVTAETRRKLEALVGELGLGAGALPGGEGPRR